MEGQQIKALTSIPPLTVPFHHKDSGSSPRMSVVPDFPNELWLHIFDFVTLVPGALNFEYDDPFQPFAAYENTPLNSGSTRKSAVRTANAFGLQIMLVCKCWHDLFGTRLYRHIHIRSHHYLADLVHKLALISDGSVPGPNSPSLGSFVCRLDLAMRDLPWPGDGWEDVLLSIERLVELLPSLQILEISSRWIMSPGAYEDSTLR